MTKPLLALGLMSGTSLDGIDAALVRTDGGSIVEPGAHVSISYKDDFRELLRSMLGGHGPVEETERKLTELHADAVRSLIAEAGIQRSDVDLIGFHGHTVLHDPAQSRTWQIGDGALLAKETGIDVVCDFRSNDVEQGGQGAPLVPIYHLALAAGLKTPLAVLNIGGVANVTYLDDEEKSLVAFDTGPGGALVDDWVNRKLGKPYDDGGIIAAAGAISETVLMQLFGSAYFDRSPPKSLDRDEFDTRAVQRLSSEDGAATLTAFTLKSIVRAVDHLPMRPERWLVTGGGRNNTFLMAQLRRDLSVPVDPVESVGWQGDALEAQAFAYLAVRSRQGLPLTFPGTTGVSEPLSGGVYYSKP
ncbi:MAG: anhydro-N-acetylmuramic acid kinase [Alphaproteobacteria bacterium]|nr:anhydro-N-acetylmuramic acid kinase [Alphaproteobacteria bacterium]